MASIYDKIQTPKELVRFVMVHGRSTKCEDICRMQDIFGRAPIEDLVALAKNELNESFPKPTRDTFYSILFGIWNWEDAVRFWNEYDNHLMDFVKKERDGLREDLQQMQQVVASLKDQLEKADARCKTMADFLDIAKDENSKTLEAATDIAAELQDAKQEILVLKAKLYDMMTKEAK